MGIDGGVGGLGGGGQRGKNWDDYTRITIKKEEKGLEQIPALPCSSQHCSEEPRRGSSYSLSVRKQIKKGGADILWNIIEPRKEGNPAICGMDEPCGPVLGEIRQRKTNIV